ncbi:hypothetical protein OTU49_010372 [Cherax quadricarinatus]|uniref:Acetyl-coenzyme A synthetase N-terminal domain-containing protein n=1 Tax=Cherax quadricarinatus TaxID=27406 RepID=A0AAW0W889_CHEQU
MRLFVSVQLVSRAVQQIWRTPQSICATRGYLHACRSFSSNEVKSAVTPAEITTTPIPEITDAFPHLQTHESIHKFSLEQPDEFWGRLARSRLEWQKEFQVVRDHDMEKSAFRWFPDGQLNVSVNCVDRHARQHPDRVALLWEKDEPGQEERVTYSH